MDELHELWIGINIRTINRGTGLLRVALVAWFADMPADAAMSLRAGHSGYA